MTIPNFNQMPMPQASIMPPQMPLPPQMQDADNAMKLFNWVKDSGLTPEQLEALAGLKKSGKDIDALLGIQKPKSDLDKLSERIDILAGAVEKLVQAWGGEGAAKQ